MIYTHVWAPVVGGLQTVTRDLANGLANWGQSHPGQAIERHVGYADPRGDDE